LRSFPNDAHLAPLRAIGGGDGGGGQEEEKEEEQEGSSENNCPNGNYSFKLLIKNTILNI
jgi:hypothetical protein